jgi:hypothetical protein
MPKYCKVSNYNIKKSLTRKSHNRLTCKKTSKKSENSGLCTVRKSTKRCVLRGWDNKPKNIVRSMKGGAPVSNCQGVKPKDACLAKGCSWVNRGDGYCRSKANSAGASVANVALKTEKPAQLVVNKPKPNVVVVPPAPVLSKPVLPAPVLAAPVLQASSKKTFPITFKFPLAMLDQYDPPVESKALPNASDLDHNARLSIAFAIKHFFEKPAGIVEQMKDLNLNLTIDVQKFIRKTNNGDDFLSATASVDKDWKLQREDIEDILGNIGEVVNQFDEYRTVESGVLGAVPAQNGKFYKCSNVLLA